MYASYPIAYSQRMLNPFHGIVNVVELEDADAVSRDGVTWQLFVHGEQEEVLLADGSFAEVKGQDVRFGTWSAAEGLRRAPVRSVVDYAFVDAVGSSLLEAVKRFAPRVPFPLRDRFELWLLDGTRQRPLALLESRCDPPGANPPPGLLWRTGERARRGFRLPDEGQDGTVASERLAALVNGACGTPARAQWFERRTDGSGDGLHGVGLSPDLPGRHLSADAFPELLLSTAWSNPAERELVKRFLHWQAPWLLQLQVLAATTRAELERAARERPFAVSEMYRLYPSAVDPSQISAARIEARLRGAADVTGAAAGEESTLLPFVGE